MPSRCNVLLLVSALLLMLAGSQPRLRHGVPFLLARPLQSFWSEWNGGMKATPYEEKEVCLHLSGQTICFLYSQPGMDDHD